MSDAQYDVYRQTLRQHRLPVAFVDLDAFDRNLEALVKRARGKPIRIASKSLRCRTLLERALAHPGCRGVMAFSPEEAVFLAAHQVQDILIAYPTVDPDQLECVAEAVANGARITLTVDDPAQLSHAQQASARFAEVTLPCCLDIDVSTRSMGIYFGVHRSPVRSEAMALALAAAIRNAPGLQLNGVLAYEAQIAGLPDRHASPARNPSGTAVHAAIRILKRRSVKQVERYRGVVVNALRRAGHVLQFVNGGGTGSLESTARDPSTTEVTAGSGLFAPALFDRYDAFQHEPAAGFALPVVRRPQSGIVTCLGGGYIASGAAGADRLPLPWLPRDATLLDTEGAGEVQTPVRTQTSLALGDPVLFRHAKAGELMERFNSVLLVRNGNVVDTVPTYRGEGMCFL